MSVSGLPILFSKVNITLANASGQLSLTTDLKMDRDSGLKSVFALGANDWVGAKQTPKKLTASWNSEVPLNIAFEYDPSNDESNGLFVTVIFDTGAMTLTTTGIIRTDGLSDGVDATAKQAITFEGKWAEWIPY